MKALLFLFLLAFASGDPGPVWLGTPMLVANGQAIRLDVQTQTSMHHALVTRVVACSAIDRPFRSFREASPELTGCNSPGFVSQEIYSISSAAHSGSLSSKFRVRQSAQSLYIRRRLIDKHSPVVYLEVHVHLQDPSAKTVAPSPGLSPEGEWTLVTRFECPERALPVGVEDYEKEKNKDQTGILSSVMTAISPAMEDDTDQLVDTSLESSVNANGIHWSVYVLFFGGALGILFVVAAIMWANRKAMVRRKMRQYKAYGMITQIPADTQGDYVETTKTAERSVISRWMTSAVQRGIFSSGDEKNLSDFL